MHLNCSHEVSKYVGATIREALSDPTLVDALHGDRVRVRFGLIDPDCVLFIDTGTGEVRPVAECDETDALIAMSTDTALDYLLGRIDLIDAEAAGAMVADECARPVLELLSAAALPSHCSEVLRREGRGDLLALAG